MGMVASIDGKTRPKKTQRVWKMTASAARRRNHIE